MSTTSTRTTIGSNRQTYTVAQIAERFQVDQHKVLTWIRNGQLRAINVATSPTSLRPRWRVTADALIAFEAARSTSPAPKIARRRRQADPKIIQFF